MDDSGLTASPDPSLNLRMVFEILTNSARNRWLQPGQAGPGCGRHPVCCSSGSRDGAGGRAAVLQGGWGVLQLGCLPASGALALPMCGSTSPVFTS